MVDAQEQGASASADRAGGLRPEPLAASQPKALIPSATPWLHIRGQLTYHAEASIVGTKAGLLALRDAIDVALVSREAEAEVFATDGEGYGLTVRCSKTVRDLGSPIYLDELARELAETERFFLASHEKHFRTTAQKLQAEQLAAKGFVSMAEFLAAQAMETRRAETLGSVGEADDSAVGETDAP